ncbi:MAG: M48 family metalloprotease [Terriglobia bacterium]
MRKPSRTIVWLAAALMVAFGSPVFPRDVPVLVHTPSNQLAGQVLANLLSSPLGKTLPRLHYRVTLLAAAPANAFSNVEGQIYVTEGLFPALYTDQGVWAAVIGHELGHVLLHHPSALPGFEARLREDYVKSRPEAAGKGRAAWPEVHLGEGISRLEFSREEEIQADFIGMMLMAEAGYQPAFEVILEQRLRYGLGDMPGFLAAFAHHPRLATREHDTQKFYAAAMDIFRMRWPDVVKSPGGDLPPYGQIGAWTLVQANGQLVFKVPYQIHNAEGTRVRIAAVFLEHNRRIAPVDPQYRASDGTLVLNAFAPGAHDKSGEAELRVPLREIAPEHDHVTAMVFLMAGNRWVDVSKRGVDLQR